ncbi:aldehyde dehydrogenase family protein [Wenyingzhuangia marina]|uniref:Succinate-semialdehyde dehydrogenase / glutarate-semialdehyde dehydrogenase n=1 Tax=Wenyingzhuangia marina TaxID=1195760 RepID=A0A1M5WRS0_9FLAO|nr:aldehyde dehydrogenase family protein [Wenyingzhuangia marina]GGF80045.1 aldehyde dehydrogenase [Wenyingzhuangia marina]SHH89804.1 succinate-semialdehyde dehydrogenase / glutarate-semialdehyde dehydrogenase [Wenyingzhuangia marina]
MIITTNPYTQKKIQQYSFLKDEELNLKLNTAQKSYKNWKNTSFKEREQLGIKLKELMLSRKESLANLISTEMGKPITQCLAEVVKTSTLVDYFTSNTANFLKNIDLDENTYVSYHPTGAVFGIMPWNFPLWQVFRYAFPNIIAGNVCLLKHAPNVTGCAIAIQQLFEDAGYPKHVFTNLIIDIPQVEQVIAHNVVQGVCLTGSTKAGSSVAALAGKYLKKSVLELGGTDASIIMEDADFDTALTSAFDSRTANSGQVCIAAKRIFVPKNKLEYAIAFFKQKIADLKQGNPLEESTQIGPISKAEFLPILQNQVEKTIKNGAELIVGGKIKEPFYETTLLVVNKENSMLKEEIFGPVICVIPYENTDTLIEEVNNSEYGLGTAIWTKNIGKAKSLAEKIEAGYVSINFKVTSDPKFPFGGIKKSGYGKELGEHGLKTFLNAKTNTIA